MKKIHLILLLAILPAASLLAQIPNSGFENWTSAGSYNTPDSWGTLNPVTAAASVYTCLKGTPGNPGTAYIKLIAKTVAGTGVVPGIAVSGVLNTTTFKPVSGFPYSSRPSALSGKWQFMAYSPDQGYIAVYLTHWNSGTHRRDTIAGAYNPLPGMVMSWQSFSIPLTYFSSATPDSAIIILSSSGATPVNGSYLYADDLLFTGGNAGIETRNPPAGLTLFPNPVNLNTLVLDYRNFTGTVGQIEILNLRGAVVARWDFTSRQFPVTLDITTLPAGEYLLRVSTTAGRFGSKFIRQ
ncbi:MAG: T9SS type A sorting domain-containing protein [Bacteroidota bacterium]